MPAKSPAQKRLMEGVAHNPSFAKKVGILQSVGKEFVGDCEITRYMAAAARGDSQEMAGCFKGRGK